MQTLIPGKRCDLFTDVNRIHDPSSIQPGATLDVTSWPSFVCPPLRSFLRRLREVSPDYGLDGLERERYGLPRLSLKKPFQRVVSAHYRVFLLVDRSIRSSLGKSIPSWDRKL